MPEGDTVWLVASRLNEAFRGGELVRTDLRVPKVATVDLRGCTTTEVAPYGKHILWRVTGSAGDFTLHSHLRMDGTWHLYDPNAPWRGGPQHWIRAVMGTDEHVAVGYRLAMVTVVPTAAEDTVVGLLGPDLLDPSLDRAAAAARWANHPHRPVGEVLLDQRVVAGLGTHLTAEICFLRGVHPGDAMACVDSDALLQTAVAVITANRARASRNPTGRRRDGSWVYGRRTCLRCQSPVQRIPVGRPPMQRELACCPACQPSRSGE